MGFLLSTFYFELEMTKFDGLPLDLEGLEGGGADCFAAVIPDE